MEVYPDPSVRSDCPSSPAGAPSSTCPWRACRRGNSLLAWVRARLPRPATSREGGCQLLIADMAAQPHPWHDFLVRELRRLRRRQGWRHGPSEPRRVA
jgi:hypothetical protein